MGKVDVAFIKHRVEKIQDAFPTEAPRIERIMARLRQASIDAPEGLLETDHEKVEKLAGRIAGLRKMLAKRPDRTTLAKHINVVLDHLQHGFPEEEQKKERPFARSTRREHHEHREISY